MTDSCNVRTIQISDTDNSRSQTCSCLHVCNENKKHGPNVEASDMLTIKTCIHLL
jgi:hypothetical protein